MNNKAKWFIRIGLAFVFIYFGIDKLINPINWLGYIPAWIEAMMPLRQFVLANGVIEIILGLGLLYDKTLRIAANIIVLFLAGVIASLGFDEVTVRDTGLLFMAIALAIWQEES
jgi:uncharacterized membrane protein